MSAFHRSGKRLQSDIVGAAVAADREEFKFLVQFSTFTKSFIRRFDAAYGGGAVFKCAMDKGIPPGRVRIYRSGHFQAASGDTDY
jgi:hypothetical protein